MCLSVCLPVCLSLLSVSSCLSAFLSDLSKCLRLSVCFSDCPSVYGFDQQGMIWYVYRPYGIWCLADVSSVSPSSEQTAVCSDEGLTLETSAKHHIPQATNLPYQPLLIKPIFSVLAHAEKQFFSKLVFECPSVCPSVCVRCR